MGISPHYFLLYPHRLKQFSQPTANQLEAEADTNPVEVGQTGHAGNHRKDGEQDSADPPQNQSIEQKYTERTEHRACHTGDSYLFKSSHFYHFLSIGRG